MLLIMPWGRAVNLSAPGCLTREEAKDPAKLADITAQNG